jgi:hypothetical protein
MRRRRRLVHGSRRRDDGLYFSRSKYVALRSASALKTRLLPLADYLGRDAQGEIGEQRQRAQRHANVQKPQSATRDTVQPSAHQRSIGLAPQTSRTPPRTPASPSAPASRPVDRSPRPRGNVRSRHVASIHRRRSRRRARRLDRLALPPSSRSGATRRAKASASAERALAAARS